MNILQCREVRRLASMYRSCCKRQIMGESKSASHCCILESKSNDHPVSILIHGSHIANMSRPLRCVVLSDADSVNPQRSLLARES